MAEVPRTLASCRQLRPACAVQLRPAVGSRLGAVHGPLCRHPLQRAERPTPPAVGAAHGQERTARRSASDAPGYHVASWRRGSRMNYLSLHVMACPCTANSGRARYSDRNLMIQEGGSMMILMCLFFPGCGDVYCTVIDCVKSRMVSCTYL